MKRKKLLALLLAFVLAFGIGIPAMAEETNVPYIITPPKDLTIGYGRSFILSVEVHVPEGWTVEPRWLVPTVIKKETSTLLTYGPYENAFRIGGSDWITFDYYIDCYDKDGNLFQLPPQTAHVHAKIMSRWAENTLGRSNGAGIAFWILIVFPFSFLIDTISGWINGLLPPVS